MKKKSHQKISSKIIVITYPDETTGLGGRGAARTSGPSGSTSICGSSGSGVGSSLGMAKDPMSLVRSSGNDMEISSGNDMEISATSRTSDNEISACSISAAMEKESDSVTSTRWNGSLSLLARRDAVDTRCVMGDVRLRMRSAALAEAGHRAARAMAKAEVLMVKMIIL